MKSLLVSVNNEKDPYPVAPVGAAYIAASLKEKGHEVRILDLCFVEDDIKAVTSSLAGFFPDVIGLSIRNIDNLTFNKSISYLPRIRSIVECIKSSTSSPVIAGGSGFSIFPEEMLRFLGLDAGIIGEGEDAFPSLMDSLAGGDDPLNIPNLCRIKDGRYETGGIRFTDGKFVPDRSLLNNSAYLELGGMANIQSKRGCPFTCSYCTYPDIDGNRLRLRDPGLVVAELEEMNKKFGIDYVFFVDDIFNFPEAHAAELCERMLEIGLKTDWTCFATPKGMTPELAGLMKKAGCKGVEFGTDAGAERTLKGLGKMFTTDDIVSASEACQRVDLPHAHYIIIGGPGEDNSTLNSTFELLDRVSPTAVIALTGVRIYPNTLLHKQAIQDNVINNDSSLLDPVFYMTPEMDVDEILERVSGRARARSNWIVPGMNIRCDAGMMALLRKQGRRGPLWDMLA